MDMKNDELRELVAMQTRTITEMQGRIGALILAKTEAEARVAQLASLHVVQSAASAAAPAAPVGPVDTPEFRNYIADIRGGAVDAEKELIAYIDAHTAAAVAQERGAAIAELHPAYEAMQLRAIDAEEKLAQASTPVAAMPEGWRLVEKKTHYQLNDGGTVVACLSGPDAESNAAIIARALAAPQQHAQAAQAEINDALDRADAVDAARFGAQAALSDGEIADIYRDTFNYSDDMHMQASQLRFARAILATRQPTRIIVPAPMIGDERPHFEKLVADHPPRSMQDAESFFVFGIQHQMSKSHPATVAAVVAQGIDLSKLQLYRRSLDSMVEADANDGSGLALYFNAGDVQQLISAQPPADAAPAWDDDATKRLRSIVDLLGLQSCVHDGDLTGYEFAVLGFVRREIERLKAAQPSPVQGDVLSQDVAKRTLIEIDADIANGGGLGRMDRMLKERAALLAEPLFQQGRAAGVEEAAKWLEKSADDYHQDQGHQESDTGAWVYPGNGQDYLNTLVELAEEIRALNK